MFCPPSAPQTFKFSYCCLHSVCAGAVQRSRPSLLGSCAHCACDVCAGAVQAAKVLEAQRTAQMEMHRALKLRRDTLAQQLEEKLNALRELCLQESVSSGGEAV